LRAGFDSESLTQGLTLSLAENPCARARILAPRRMESLLRRFATVRRTSAA
jgi:hypothetical protein